MSSQNEEKAKHQQSILDRIKANGFEHSNQYCSDEESIKLSNILQYGFRYNAGQEPVLKDEFVDYHAIVELLKTAKNNDEKTGQTNFPDWVCKNGLIEHFAVTATEDIEKGQLSRKLSSKAEKELNNQLGKDAKVGNLTGYYCKEYQMPEQTIENFINSFKKHWESHINKLRKYNGIKTNVCFLIESDCFGLIQELEPSVNYQLGVYTGKIVEHYMYNKHEHFSSALLGRCKELLEYIYQYNEEVQYVLFVSPVSIELIKTDKASYIAGLLKSYNYYASSTRVSHNAYNVLNMENSTPIDCRNSKGNTKEIINTHSNVVNELYNLLKQVLNKKQYEVLHKLLWELVFAKDYAILLKKISSDFTDLNIAHYAINGSFTVIYQALISALYVSMTKLMTDNNGSETIYNIYRIILSNPPHNISPLVLDKVKTSNSKSKKDIAVLNNLRNNRNNYIAHLDKSHSVTMFIASAEMKKNLAEIEDLINKHLNTIYALLFAGTKTNHKLPERTGDFEDIVLALKYTIKNEGKDFSLYEDYILNK